MSVLWNISITIRELNITFIYTIKIRNRKKNKYMAKTII